MRVYLYTNWYKAKAVERNTENETCLRINLENPIIDKIYLLCDDDKDFPVHKKIIGIRGSRATYNSFFKVMNESKPDISIMANSDIYFDKTLDYLKFLKEADCYALTRWDVVDGNSIFFNRQDSQDVWIFKGVVKVNAPFESGRLGCDNRIAYELKQTGYMVTNPSKTIKVYHLHSEARAENENHDKSKTIPPPYEYVLPAELRPFISIVTRNYYKREEMFKNCCASVSMQKDQDFDHVIIKDMVGIGSAKANRLFYSNKDRVRGEYVFMLDDDDIFTSDEFVGDMKGIVAEHSPGLIFVRMLINEELYPTSVVWKRERLHQNHVGTSNVVVRNDLWQKYIERFSDSQVGDFLFINSVFMEKPKIYWQDKLYSKTTRISHGQP
jgi:hypothetical protein